MKLDPHTQETPTKYWIDVSDSSGSILHGRGYIFKLAVIIDSAIAAQFQNRIRIIITSGPTFEAPLETQERFMITNCLLPASNDPWTSRPAGTLRILGKGEQTHADHSSMGPHKALPTVTLEAITLKEEGIGYSYSQFHRTLLLKQQAPESAPPNILYNGVHTLTEGLSGEQILLLYLESYYPVLSRLNRFKHLDSLAGPVPRKHTTGSRCAVYEIRVFPVSRVSNITAKSAAGNLPPNVVKRIVTIYFVHNLHGHADWRQQLLQIGLLSRCWNPVLDLFFQIHTWSALSRKLPRNTVTISSTEKSLLHRSDRGRISFFSMQNYSEYWRSHLVGVAGPLLLTAVRLLKLSASSITTLYLFPIPAHLCSDYMDSLLQLSTLVNCYENPESQDRLPSSAPLSINQIIFLLSKWTKLRCLQLDTNRSLQGMVLTHDHSKLDSMQIGFTHDIEILDLSSIHLESIQFHRFLNTSKIAYLRLYNLTGPLTNQDLFSALYASRKTLETLDIEGCNFSRSSPDEEYALDNLFASCESIFDITIRDSDCLSWKAFESKPCSGLRRGYITLYGLPAFVSANFPKIAQSLLKTEWHVHIGRYEPDQGTVDQAVIRSACQVAKERGLQFGWVIKEDY